MATKRKLDIENWKDGRHSLLHYVHRNIYKLNKHMHMHRDINNIQATHAKQKANKFRYTGGRAHSKQHAKLTPKLIHFN